MNEKKINEKLAHSLDCRQQKIGEALQFVEVTRELFDRYASQELKHIRDSLEGLEKGLKSTDLRLVVIGEFSRGKSMLVNALLGIHLLRSANEATTAINTFIQPLPESEQVPYIMVYFQDESKNPMKLKWDNDDVLEKWGTELDSENRSARQEVERIEIFTTHDLLEKGLVLIDTPGLESVVEYHKDITMKAIDQAHIAIWVQSAEQLGGNAREWLFLKDTIRKNFRKFITVINKWDKVLEPDDEYDRKKPTESREKEKMDKVKDQFREQLAGIPKHELETLISSENLMGVSAAWGLKKDNYERFLKSGIQKLSERIALFCDLGESNEEILHKPLKQLKNIHEKFLRDLDERAGVLGSSQDLNERKRQLEMLELEIKNYELDKNNQTKEAAEEHRNNAVRFADEMQHSLVEPLRELKSDIENIVTPEYIERLMNQKQTSICLPDDLQKKFGDVTIKVYENWENQKKSMERALSDLRESYESSMKKYVDKIKTNLDSIHIEMPRLDISLDLDLSSIESYYDKKMKIEQDVSECENDLASLEVKIAENQENSLKIEEARRSVERAEKKYQNLGPQPSPTSRTERECVKEGSLWSDPKYENKEVIDNTSYENWVKEKDKLDRILDNKEDELKKIIDEEARKSGRRVSAEVAQKKLDQKINALRRNAANIEKQEKEERQQIINNTYQRLVKGTAGELDRRIGFLEKHAEVAVRNIFEDQLKALISCVDEQVSEPLQAKRGQREDALKLIEQGETEVKKEIARIEAARQKLDELSATMITFKI